MQTRTINEPPAICFLAELDDPLASRHADGRLPAEAALRNQVLARPLSRKRRAFREGPEGEKFTIGESSSHQPLVATCCHCWDLDTAGRKENVLPAALLKPRPAVITA